MWLILPIWIDGNVNCRDGDSKTFLETGENCIDRVVLGKICWNRMGMGINSWELGGDGDSVLYHLICFSHVHKKVNQIFFWLST